MGVLVVGGCTSPSVPGEIKNVPVCPDFDMGVTRMKGSLRKPVKVTILEDDDPRWERDLFGKRALEDKDPVFSVEDDDETFIVRFAQCANEFAPRPVEATNLTTDRAGGFSCGEAKVYKEIELAVRDGDAGSRVIEWQEPPEKRCWDAGGTPVTPTGASASAASAASAETPPP